MKAASFRRSRRSISISMPSLPRQNRVCCSCGVTHSWCPQQKPALCLGKGRRANKGMAAAGVVNGMNRIGPNPPCTGTGTANLTASSGCWGLLGLGAWEGLAPHRHMLGSTRPLAFIYSAAHVAHAAVTITTSNKGTPYMIYICGIYLQQL